MAFLTHIYSVILLRRPWREVSWVFLLSHERLLWRLWGWIWCRFRIGWVNRLFVRRQKRMFAGKILREELSVWGPVKRIVFPFQSTLRLTRSLKPVLSPLKRGSWDRIVIMNTHERQIQLPLTNALDTMKWNHQQLLQILLFQELHLKFKSKFSRIQNISKVGVDFAALRGDEEFREKCNIYKECAAWGRKLQLLRVPQPWNILR